MRQLHQRPGLDRQEARPRAPSIRRARRLRPTAASSSSDHRVGAEPREQRHVVGAHHGADRIDLQQAEPGEHAVEMAAVDRRRSAAASPKPCAASAMRRARASEILSFMRWPLSDRMAGDGSSRAGIAVRAPTLAALRGNSVRRIKWSDLRRKSAMRAFSQMPCRGRAAAHFGQGLTCFARSAALTLAALQHGPLGVLQRVNLSRFQHSGSVL